MNRPNLFFYSVILCATLFTSSCKKEDKQNKEREELEQLYNQIKDIAESSTCGQNQELKHIAVGAKACGGPTSYLVYSTSINVTEFETLVLQYNEKQKNYNNKWGAISDCTIVGPPKSIVCENGKPKINN
ncbi:hypothetical protein [Pedobacter ureilyticus]|jgi:hypothetical protein|uniref:Lipoprotein n=1 Tax=Pedobacter ureilyticus TaxID=1393051 RepID=A0ABW9J423_9SPHI|nr:hypothetical protein [Pedobacter helvus]